MKSLVTTLLLLFSGSVFGNTNELIGGSQVNPSEWPEVIRIFSGRSYCSAAVIGPYTVLTAGHCTTEGGGIEPVSEDMDYHFLIDQEVFKANCTLTPSYRDGRRGVGSHDLAVCRSDKEIKVKYAQVSDKEPEPGDKATLIGYGCTSSDRSGGNDGTLRVGEAVVSRQSTDSSYHWYTKDSVTLCPGDSGGPAFLHVNDPRNETHFVAGVNSMGDFVEWSLLTSVPRSFDFLRDYAASQGVEICGINRDCTKAEPSRCQSEILNLKQAVERVEQCLR